MRESWHERFAESPDVLKSERRPKTVVPVLDLEIGGDEFITMAGPCSVETEFQLMATANHVRRAGARILRGGAFKPRSSPYSFQGLGLEGLKMLARAREESGVHILYGLTYVRICFDCCKMLRRLRQISALEVDACYGGFESGC